MLVHVNMDTKGTHTSSAARRHLSAETSSMVPWISTRSSACVRSSIVSPRMALASLSLLALPVMKFRWVGGGIFSGLLCLFVCLFLSLAGLLV